MSAEASSSVAAPTPVRRVTFDTPPPILTDAEARTTSASGKALRSPPASPAVSPGTRLSPNPARATSPLGKFEDRLDPDLVDPIAALKTEPYLKHSPLRAILARQGFEAAKAQAAVRMEVARAALVANAQADTVETT